MSDVFSRAFAATIGTVGTLVAIMLIIFVVVYVYDNWHYFSGWVITMVIFIMIWIAWVFVFGVGKLLCILGGG